jgi:geranylgeranyl reductase
LLNHKLEYLKRFDNIKILKNAPVSKIPSNRSLEFGSGQKLKFKFLVGADGSTSVVRKYLNLPLNNFGITFQYLIPQKFENFEIHLDDKLFGTGYLWIFPHKNFTAVGCGSDIKSMKTKQLRNNLDWWLKQNDIDTSQAKFESAVINCDYKGYKFFDNIFLAGDAAGLTSGTTGKGIYSAFLSGKQIADDILQKNNSPNLITNWLKRKRQQEKFLFFLRSPLRRKIFFSLSMKAMTYQKIQKKIIKLI